MQEIDTNYELALKEQQTKYSLTDEFPNGSSLQGYINIAPSVLIDLFGQPQEADGYKVSGEYTFKRNSDGLLFTLYDWKCTSLYDGGCVSPEEFWASSRPYAFHIGGRGSEGIDELIDDLTHLLSLLNLS